MDYLTQYSNWFKGNMEQKKIDEHTSSLMIPLLTRNNDFVEIYIQEENDSYFLTDGGETLGELSMEGISVEDMKLKQILNSYGIMESDSELFVKCSYGMLPLKIHMFAMCMLQVSNSFN